MNMATDEKVIEQIKEALRRKIHCMKDDLAKVQHGVSKMALKQAIENCEQDLAFYKNQSKQRYQQTHEKGAIDND